MSCKERKVKKKTTHKQKNRKEEYTKCLQNKNSKILIII